MLRDIFFALKLFRRSRKMVEGERERERDDEVIMKRIKDRNVHSHHLIYHSITIFITICFSLYLLLLFNSINGLRQEECIKQCEWRMTEKMESFFTIKCVDKDESWWWNGMIWWWSCPFNWSKEKDIQCSRFFGFFHMKNDSIIFPNFIVFAA